MSAVGAPDPRAETIAEINRVMFATADRHQVDAWSCTCRSGPFSVKSDAAVHVILRFLDSLEGAGFHVVRDNQAVRDGVHEPLGWTCPACGGSGAVPAEPEEAQMHIHDLPDEVVRLAYSWSAPRVSSGEVEYLDSHAKAEARMNELFELAREKRATISNLRVWSMKGPWVEMECLDPMPPRLVRAAAVPAEPEEA